MKKLLMLSAVLLCSLTASALTLSAWAGEAADADPEKDADLSQVIEIDISDQESLDSCMETYRDLFAGADVKLLLTGSAEYYVQFLTACEFHTLELELGESNQDFSSYLSEIGSASDIDGLIKLTTYDINLNDCGTFEQLEELYLKEDWSGNYAYKNLSGEAMPNLKKLTLDFYDQDIFDYLMNSRGAQFPAALEAIDIRIDGSLIPTKQLEYTSLMTAMAMFCPDAEINTDITAQEMLSVYLEQGYKSEIMEDMSDSYLFRCYLKAVNEEDDVLPYNEEDAKITGKLLFVVITSDFIQEATYDQLEEEDDLYSIPLDYLGDSCFDADTAVIITSKNVWVGTYLPYGGSAYEKLTKVIVCDLNNDLVYEPYTVYTSEPPQTLTTTVVGANGYGSFMPEEAITYILDQYDYSWDKAEETTESEETDQELEEIIQDIQEDIAETETEQESEDILADTQEDIAETETEQESEDILPDTQEDNSEDIISRILEVLDNENYNLTYESLKNGETITNGTYSTIVNGLQQALVELGCDIAIDGSAGPGTFSALNYVQQVCGAEETDIVDQDTFGLIMELVLLSEDSAEDTDPAYDILHDYLNSGSENSDYYRYMKGCAYYLIQKYYNAEECFWNSNYGNYEEMAEQCQQDLPQTGEIWHNSSMYSNSMSLTVEVNSTSDDEGMYIEVYTADGVLASSMFIKGTGSVTTYIPAGEYRIRDCSGTEWFGTGDAFGPYGYYEYMEFYQYDGDDSLIYLEDWNDWIISVNVDEVTGTGVGSDSMNWNEWN